MSTNLSILRLNLTMRGTLQARHNLTTGEREARGDGGPRKNSSYPRLGKMSSSHIVGNNSRHQLLCLASVQPKDYTSPHSVQSSNTVNIM